jgi:hypothetical protein
MALTQFSPGVVTIENEQPIINNTPILVGAAIIGPTTKGPVEIPTIITSYSEYLAKYGNTFTSGSQVYSYLTSISAYNYFQNGGDTLLVTRVTSGSFTEATSSTIASDDTFVVDGYVVDDYFIVGSGVDSFVLETFSEGVIMNSTSDINPDGSLPSGSEDNLRWQITSPDIDTGTFTLLIRRGNDDTNSPVVLETWTNLSLDPVNPNYIEKIIGNQAESIMQDGSEYYVDITGNFSNQSNYVRVKQVNTPTPDYLDNQGDPKSEYTSSIPSAQIGDFGGAIGSNIPVTAGNYYKNIDNSNTQGLIATDYDQSIALLANTDEFKYNYITVPGLIKDFASHSSTVSTLVANCQERGDTFAVIDLTAYQANTLTVTNEAKSINNSYAAAYWPWVQTLDPFTAQQIWTPASTLIPGVYAFNDASAEVWSAPAGTARGVMSTAIRAERKLSKTTRDDLYKANVNPIATLQNTGITVFGQKTLKKKQSATDRIGVRRLLIELKTQIGSMADNLVFEQNTVSTRNDFLSQVNPYLSSIQQRQGLIDFKVIMDDTNNTPNVIDNNQLVGAIYIKPTKTAEFISLSFNITPTGATFT